MWPTRRQTREKRSELTRKYRCRLLPTLAIPLIVQGGTFLCTSLMLRYAVIWPDTSTQRPGSPTAVNPTELSEVIVHDHPLIDASADALEGIRSFVGTSTAISREAWAWCPSLAQADPHYVLPVVVGMISLSAVEIAFASRGLVDRATALLAPATPPRKLANGTTLPEPRKLVLTLFQFVARTLSVGFIAIALNAPAVRLPLRPSIQPPRRTAQAVCIYWLTSFSMTAVQNIYFTKLDREKVARLTAQYRELHPLPVAMPTPIEVPPFVATPAPAQLPRRPMPVRVARQPKR
jgi:hypothetical protein